MNAGPGRRLAGQGYWRRLAASRPVWYRRDASRPPRPAATASGRTAARTAALAVTLGVAARCWVIAVRLINGIDTGMATRLGSFASVIAVRVWMMAARWQG